MKIRYRNTGFIRQLFIYYKNKYHGVEVGEKYARYYRLTPEGVLPKYKEIRR